jgi:Ca2+-transporting ATPase
MHDMGGEGIVSTKAKLTEDKLLSVIQFTSSRKKASVVVKTNTGVRVYTKGAPDMLFPDVTSIVGADGSPQPIDQKMNVDQTLLSADEQGRGTVQETGTEIMNRTVKLFAKNALRTILMCYRDYSHEEYAEL